MSASTVPHIDTTTNKSSSVLDVILTAFTKNTSGKKEELKVYDEIKFVNANKEVNAKEKKDNCK